MKGKTRRKFRRHTNNLGLRQIKSGKAVKDLKEMVKRIFGEFDSKLIFKSS